MPVPGVESGARSGIAKEVAIGSKANELCPAPFHSMSRHDSADNLAARRLGNTALFELRNRILSYFFDDGVL